MTATVGAEELASLRDSVRGFLGRYSSPTKVREQMVTPEGFDAVVWQQLSDQLGVPAMTVPEEYGGLGFGPVEQGVVLHEAGRSLLCAPLLSSAVAATNVVLLAGDEASKKELLPGLASGTVRATVAFGEDGWAQGTRSPRTSAVVAGDQWRVTGSKRRVLDGLTATAFLVTAHTRAGVSLFVVDGAGEGIERRPLAAMDMTRKQADVVFTAAPARLVGSESGVKLALARAHDATLAALAVEQAGAAERCLELIVDFLQVREQFGRVLGSFQALKHRCATLRVEVEAARAIAAAAVDAAAAEDWEDLDLVAALAKASCSDVLAHASAECVQLHGGIGFTWEHEAHLYFKRARGAQYLFGDPASYRARAATSMGL